MVEITDPHHRFYRVEFQGGHGESLRYNRNGNSHSSGSGGTRSDTYQLGAELSSDIRMVLWIITDRSRVTVPFSLTDVPIQ